ncbi:hypothetical protein A8C32_06250 [Flavivirga aquatica]|uniref:LTD domain-containing protein n=1 Tax=Flavivirga aquatica TaxID=1849968 RepID=A0A1E5SI54_9FLAO|nr:lamin tail domain-containing protein [Flavivirga aquatica]OEJ98795.1 hypothetical protein A8C32_06250 [Flavivirga aquatica]
MKKIFLLLALVTTTLYSQNIVINEVQAKNFRTYVGPFPLDTYLNWIELKNTTASEIDIGNYFLSNDSDDIEKWTFPLGTVISANGFLLIHAGGDNINKTSAAAGTHLNTNFKLSPLGESVILSNVDGSEIHKIEYPPMQNDISYARLNDGSFSFMNAPTPNAENLDTTAFKLLDSDIKISVASGLYASGQTVEITNTGEGEIYYTIDGTIPSTSSLVYTTPISINENTILKAIAIKSISEFSIIENRSYIIGASHDLPLVLLTSDNSSFNHRNKEVIDGRVAFSFIETDGRVVINQYANFRASGKTSLSQPQLNGKIKADKIYGDDDFDYKMYPNKNIGKFDSFLLRNASQDWSETHMRDAFMSRLLGQDNLADFPFEGYRPAVLYVNARYQGIINVREDDDSDYVKHNFGLKKNEFEKSGRDQIIYGFTTDRTELENKLNFNDHVNVQFLISYADLNEYGFGSWKDLSGKTAHENHYYMHDYDATFGLFGEEHVPLVGPMSVSSIVPSEMRRHEPYKNEALQFIAATLNHIYNKERTISIINTMESELESEIPAHAIINSQLAIDQDYNRSNIPPFANVTEWKNNVNALRKDVEGRLDAAIFTRIKNEYGLEDPIQVTYESSDINKGLVRVHNVKSIKETFTGTYFKNIPIRFSAEALPGYKFVRWEGDVSGTDAEIAPVFSTNASIKAVFEPIAIGSTNIVINEIQGKNDATIADENGEYDDWIEIYNPENTAVNLAGYYISDDTAEPLKWKITDTDASKTTVAGKGYLLLWADKELSQGANHLDFKLKGTDEVLLTSPDATTLIQQISFIDIDTDTSYGATFDGDTEYITFSAPTPGATNGSDLRLSKGDLDINNTKIKVYPNPTRGLITITNLSKGDRLTWKLYNITGQIIKSGTQTEIDIEEINKGLYILNINDNFNVKVIKQ